MCSLIKFAGLCDIYRICFNRICASTYPFSYTNMRVTIPQPGDTPVDVTPDKFVEELTKSVNGWRWLHIHISAAQSKI